MKINANTIFIILSAGIVAAGVYWYFDATYAGTEPPLTTDVTQNVDQVQFQTLVTQLQPISFKNSILNDPRFLALRDLTTPVAQEPAGRPDPFAPVAGISAP